MKLTASTSTLSLLYSSKHVIPPVAARYIGSPTHPIAPKIAHCWAARDRNILWWRVSVSHITDSKRVIRSWCARRARIAFEQALRDNGFDRLGTPLPYSSSSPQQGPLKGSLDVIVRPAFVKQTFETVQQDAHSVLESILKQRAIHNAVPPKKSEVPPGFERA